MIKPILLYGSFGGQLVTDTMRSLSEATSETIMRISSNGGSPEDTWGLVAVMNEFEYKIKIKVDGRAHSTAAFLLAYSDDVEALDVSEFLIHRAAYSRWLEESETFFTEQVKGNLKRINDSLRKALEAKIDVDKFEKIAGISLDDIFDMDSRKEVFLNARQAKQIGLINKITKITPEKKAEIEMFGSGFSIAAETEESREKTNNRKMTREEFKIAHPEAYAEIFKEGVESEKDRVGAWFGFADVDLKAVKEGIDGGKDISQTVMVELTRKSIAKAAAGDAESDSPNADKTDTELAEDKANEDADKAKPEAEKAKEKAEADFKAEFSEKLGLNKNG